MWLLAALAIPQAPTLLAGAIVVEHLGEHEALIAWYPESNGSETPKPLGSRRLRPGDAAVIRSATPVVLAWSPAGSTRSLTLRPGRLYAVRDLRADECVVDEVELGDLPDWPTAGGPTAGGPADPSAARLPATLRVELLIDEHLGLERDAAELRRREIEQASQWLESHCGIRLEVVGERAWRPDKSLDDAGLATRLAADLAPTEQRDVVIAFTKQPAPGRPAEGCPCAAPRLLDGPVVVREPRELTESEGVELVLHKFAHYLGAIHSSQSDSLLRSSVPDGRARLRDHSLRIDGPNLLVLTLVADLLAEQATAKSAPETLRALRSHVQTVRHRLASRAGVQLPDIEPPQAPAPMSQAVADRRPGGAATTASSAGTAPAATASPQGSRVVGAASTRDPAPWRRFQPVGAFRLPDPLADESARRCGLLVFRNAQRGRPECLLLGAQDPDRFGNVTRLVELSIPEPSRAGMGRELPEARELRRLEGMAPPWISPLPPVGTARAGYLASPSVVGEAPDWGPRLAKLAAPSTPLLDAESLLTFPPARRHPDWGVAHKVCGACWLDLPAIRAVCLLVSAGQGPLQFGSGAEAGDPWDGSTGYHAPPYTIELWWFAQEDLLGPGARVGRVRAFARDDLTPQLGACDPRRGLGLAHDPATGRLFLLTTEIDASEPNDAPDAVRVVRVFQPR